MVSSDRSRIQAKTYFVTIRKEESETFIMRARIIGIVICLVAIVIIGVYWYQSSNGPLFQATYKIGDEIKGFPVREISLTIRNVTTSKTLNMSNIQGNLATAPIINGEVGQFNTTGLGDQDEYVILTVTIHNLENYQIYFNRSDDLGSRLLQAWNSRFVLSYGTENHEAYPQCLMIIPYGENVSSGIVNYWGWGINMMSASEVTSLAPNQTAYGALYFIIGEYYTPNELICRDDIQTNPIFTVNLNS
jgi:hypothetical protein